MPKIYIDKREICFEKNLEESLMKTLIKENVFIDNPCNGRGSCGKCKVRLVGGELSALTDTEKNFLTESEIESGVRLACLTAPVGDVEIDLLQAEGNHKILTKGYVPEFEYEPLIRKEVFTIKKPTIENQTPLEDSICEVLEVEGLDVKILKEINYKSEKMTAIFSGDKLIGIENEDTMDKLYGIAIDIGTTTVISSLVDLNTGKEIIDISKINPQKKFGLDVLTRITYAIENRDTSRGELQESLTKCINEMIEEACKEVGISIAQIYEVVVAANCTMINFLLGIDATSIGISPYTPIFISSKDLEASSVGIKISPFGRLYCMPSVSSYIGADIVSGVYACGLNEEKGNVLFIDIGTNGEIVLSSGGRLTSCSCAAGPALEGMNINSGIRAQEGAIEEIVIGDKALEVKVIGNKEPMGICGSGILSIVKELIRVGLVKKSGVFIKKEKIDKEDYKYKLVELNNNKREFVIGVGEKNNLIKVTQSDIRQVQLAKGAILSGFYTLLNSEGIDMGSLDKVIIAGQFGSHLPVESLVGTGILPSEVKDKIQYVGNTSKTGAYMSLMSKKARSDMEQIAKKIGYIELGASEGYERLFAESLLFR